MNTMYNNLPSLNENTMLETGQSFSYAFKFTQEEVNQFAELTGDHNPLHKDPEYAAQTQFKKPIIHGVFTTSVFSKVCGTIFPGEGTIYLSQKVNFLRPMYVDTDYEACFKVLDIDPKRHKARIETAIYDKNTGKKALDGEATIMNKEKIN